MYQFVCSVTQYPTVQPYCCWNRMLSHPTMNVTASSGNLQRPSLSDFKLDTTKRLCTGVVLYTTNKMVHSYSWLNANLKNAPQMPCLFTASRRRHLERCDNSCYRIKRRPREYRKCKESSIINKTDLAGQGIFLDDKSPLTSLCNPNVVMIIESLETPEFVSKHVWFHFIISTHRGVSARKT